MRKAWKYPLILSDIPQLIKLPGPNNLVHVGQQRGQIVLWFEVEEVENSLADYDRNFLIVGTGHEIPYGPRHKGTVQIGEYVWHVYEVSK
jgi:hypothetical protein